MKLNQPFFRLGLLGFHEEIFRDISLIINKWSLECELINVDDSFQHPQGLAAGCVDPDLAKIDIFLIVPNLEENFLQKTLLALELKGCAKDVILLSFQQNYDYIVNAFRSGIKDVLRYPFEEEEVIHVLHRVFGHWALNKKIQAYERGIDETQSYPVLHQQSLINNYLSYIQKQLADDFAPEETFFFCQNKNASVSSINNSPPLNEASLKARNDFFYAPITRFFLEQEQIEKHERNQQRPTYYHLDSNDKNSGILIFFLGYYTKETVTVQPSETPVFWLAVKDSYHQNLSPELREKHLFSMAKFCFLSFQLLLHHSKEKYLGQLVLTDDVTGLYNQRCLKRDMENFIQQSQVVPQKFSLLFIDIDHFKSVNDKNGHLTGSFILSALGRKLRKVVRETDFIYRYGGDEFIILLPEADKTSAYKVGMRILKMLQLVTFKIPPSLQHIEGQSKTKIQLSVSIGIAEYPADGNTVEEIMGMADDLLYQAKNEGRGRVSFVKTPANLPLVKIK